MEMENNVEMKKAFHFVFVHGFMHGAWCWYKIRTLLESKGHKVTCLDLTGAGVDITDPNTISDLTHYNKPLLDFMSQLSLHDKVILIGHSAGGLSLTQAIQQFGTKILVAIYLTAIMLGPPQARRTDLWDYIYALGPDKPPTSAILKDESQRPLLYHMSPREDSTLASMLLRPGPISAVAGASFSPTEEMNKVKRVYIKALQDKILEPEDQDQMIKMWPPSKVLLIDTEHSPFFSAPNQLLSSLLEAIAEN